MIPPLPGPGRTVWHPPRLTARTSRLRLRCPGQETHGPEDHLQAGSGQRVLPARCDSVDPGRSGPGTPFQCPRLFRHSTEEGCSTPLEKVQGGHRVQKGLAAKTVNSRIEFARQVFRWAVHLELCAKNPFLPLKPVKGAGVRDTRPFTPEEIRCLLHVAKKDYPWFYPVLAFISVTGARRESVRLLEVRDFDQASGVVTLRDEIAKRNRGQQFALPAGVREIIRRQTEGRLPSEPLFRSAQGRRLSDNAFDVPPYLKQRFRSVWRRVLDAAGVEPRGIHNLRASVVTNLVEADCTLELAVEITGHSTEIARRHYLKTRLASQRQTMSLLEKTLGLGVDIGTEVSVVPDEEVKDRRSSGGDDEADHQPAKDIVVLRLTEDQARSLLCGIERLLALGNSGTNSGTDGKGESVSPVKSGRKKSMAERGGFEPPHEVDPRGRFSKPLPSATRPPLRGRSAKGATPAIVSGATGNLFNPVFPVSIRCFPSQSGVSRPGPCPPGRGAFPGAIRS